MVKNRVKFAVGVVRTKKSSSSIKQEPKLTESRASRAELSSSPAGSSQG